MIIDGENLIHYLGYRLDDTRFIDLLESYDLYDEEIEWEKESFLENEAEGISAHFLINKSSKIFYSLTFYSRSVYKNQGFQGKLPLKLNFNLKQSDILSLLGKPDQSFCLRDEVIAEKWNHTYTIYIRYKPPLFSKIKQITIKKELHGD